MDSVFVAPNIRLARRARSTLRCASVAVRSVAFVKERESGRVGDEIVFVEVKTGASATQSTRERRVRDAVVQAPCRPARAPGGRSWGRELSLLASQRRGGIDTRRAESGHVARGDTAHGHGCNPRRKSEAVPRAYADEQMLDETTERERRNETEEETHGERFHTFVEDDMFTPECTRGGTSAVLSLRGRNGHHLSHPRGRCLENQLIAPSHRTSRVAAPDVSVSHTK